MLGESGIRQLRAGISLWKPEIKKGHRNGCDFDDPFLFQVVRLMVRYVFLKDMIGYRKGYYIRETGKTFKDR